MKSIPKKVSQTSQQISSKAFTILRKTLKFDFEQDLYFYEVKMNFFGYQPKLYNSRNLFGCVIGFSFDITLLSIILVV